MKTHADTREKENDFYTLSAGMSVLCRSPNIFVAAVCIYDTNILYIVSTNVYLVST